MNEHLLAKKMPVGILSPPNLTTDEQLEVFLADYSNPPPWATPMIRKSSLRYVLASSLVVPGIGHLFIGQSQKSALYLVSFFLLALGGILTLEIFVGVALLILCLALYAIIQWDMAVMCYRLHLCFPICEGEFASTITAFGLNYIVPQLSFISMPVFVSDSTRAPEVYIKEIRKQQMDLRVRHEDAYNV
ncbi:hypothetical protein J8273_7159 [Carpediemonas membranifera]|uniref:Uncharacterized protein n=1 Tax=Carpediemonas membranifera TaxID=201153 RepID=A0A8J6DXS5_9EUKA|nr:hypothetical protein J8273_7159 [Carpediemonas membranifera]|eukprot:KAG9390894.1 hypothetical protein J8273_7159 [Carpediemonas membranifera]